jgi:hypothetical protein
MLTVGDIIVVVIDLIMPHLLYIVLHLLYLGKDGYPLIGVVAHMVMSVFRDTGFVRE